MYKCIKRWVLRGFWVIVRPNPLELVQVVSAEHSPVSCEVFKVVHDHSDEQIDDLREEQKEINVTFTGDHLF